MLAEKMFAKGIANQIKTFLPPEYEEAECQVMERLKNNGVSQVGVSIHMPGEKTSPIIYVESFYKDVKEGRPIAGVMEEIAGLVKSSHTAGRITEGIHMEDFQYVKPYLKIALVNTNANCRKLSHMPHMEMEDLSMICQVAVPLPDGMRTMQVTDDVLKGWKISKEALFDTAMKNTEKSDSYIMRRMSDILEEIMPGSTDSRKPDDVMEADASDPDDRMYVLTNRDKAWGASAMLCPSMMEHASRIFLKGFYILPSSVHEVLLVQKDGVASAQGLGQLVRDVNETMEDKTEILSGCIYEYDKNCGKIRQVPESVEKEMRGMER
jgi:hypothetical protein